MKTLKDLVNELNSLSYLHRGDYRLKKGRYDGMLDIYYKGSAIISFDLEHGEYCFAPATPLAPFDAQRIIVEYLSPYKPQDWIEKKYNIIIGTDISEKGITGLATVYSKRKSCSNFDYNIVPVDRYSKNINEDRFQFTEEEIRKLKEVLPDNMAKIVDLGKVEVK